MLVALASVKGSPGTTSTALTLASVWPRDVVVVEADTSGGDLAYRCRAATGGPVYASKGLLTLAAAVRSGMPSTEVIFEQSQLLACGVNLVQGVASAGQARGLSALWPALASACQVSQVDVLVDLGRIDGSSAALPIAQAADVVLPIASASLESFMHLSHGLTELLPALMRQPPTMPGAVVRPAGQRYLAPLLVGDDSHVERDCADLDDLLTRAGHQVGPALPLAYDRKALVRLEEGEKASSRLGRTLLLRRARQISANLASLGPEHDQTASSGPAPSTRPAAPQSVSSTPPQPPTGRQAQPAPQAAPTTPPRPAAPSQPAYSLPPYDPTQSRQPGQAGQPGGPGQRSNAGPVNGVERSQP